MSSSSIIIYNKYKLLSNEKQMQQLCDIKRGSV